MSKRNSFLVYIIIPILITSYIYFNTRSRVEEEPIQLVYNTENELTNQIQKIFHKCVKEDKQNKYKVDLSETRSHEKKEQYCDFLWITEQDEIKLIQHYDEITLEATEPFSRGSTGQDEINKILKKCREQIYEFLLSQKFIVNSKNHYDSPPDETWVMRQLSLEHGDMKASIHRLHWKLVVTLGDIKTSNTPEGFQEIYDFMLPKRDLKSRICAYSFYDNFAFVGLSTGVVGNYQVLEKDANNKWYEKFILYQYTPPCREFVEANIPPELFEQLPQHLRTKQHRECRDEENLLWHYDKYLQQTNLE